MFLEKRILYETILSRKASKYIIRNQKTIPGFNRSSRYGRVPREKVLNSKNERLDVDTCNEHVYMRVRGKIAQNRAFETYMCPELCFRS